MSDSSDLPKGIPFTQAFDLQLLFEFPTALPEKQELLASLCRQGRSGGREGVALPAPSWFWAHPQHPGHLQPDGRSPVCDGDGEVHIDQT